MIKSKRKRDKKNTQTSSEASSIQSSISQDYTKNNNDEELQKHNMTRKEAKAKAKEIAIRQKQLKAEAKQRRKSVRDLARKRDKSLSDEFYDARERRRTASDVYDFIGFDYMYKDGTCEVEKGLWSQTLRFSDISYQAAQDDDRMGYFESYSEIFNSAGSNVTIQINIINTQLLKEEIGSREFFRDVTGEAYSSLLAEYNSVLNRKMLEGRSNIVKNRYITFAVPADSYEEALPKLASVRTDFTRSLTKLGCVVDRVGGEERLKIIHSQLRPGRKFEFNYEELYAGGLSAKDYVCPNTLDFEPEEDISYAFKTDDKWGEVLIISDFGSQLADNALSEIIDLPIPMNISLHVQAINRGEDVDKVREVLTWIDKEIADKQQSALQKGYDPDALPQVLRANKTAAEDLLDDLIYKNQRLFLFTGLVYVYADTYDELQQYAEEVRRAAKRGSLKIDECVKQQKIGLNSALPLGHNHMFHSRYLTTANVSMLIPFATIEMFQEQGGYYGQNKDSHNLVIFSRKSLPNPAGFVLGSPGSGKSFSVKREITNTRFIDQNAEIIIFDPNNEYPYLTQELGGEVVVLAPGSSDFINIFDVFDDGEDITKQDPIAFKSETILALMSHIMCGPGEELSARTRSLIDRCVHLVYDRFANSTSAPTLGDFVAILREQQAPESDTVADSLELYTTGSLRYFNHETTKYLNNKTVCFTFKQLGKNMRTFAMLVLLDYAYNRMLYNFNKGITTWLYIDEAQSMFYEPALVDYFNKFWSEGRKFNLIPTAITQTIERVLIHEEARFMMSNSGMLMLFGQSATDHRLLSELLNLSPQQQKYISSSVTPGDGLLCLGAAKIPIEDKWPKGPLYELWNTKPEEIAERKRAKWLEQAAQARQQAIDERHLEQDDNQAQPKNPQEGN